MKLSAKQLVLFGILALAAGALIVDKTLSRLGVTNPNSASGEVSASNSAAIRPAEARALVIEAGSAPAVDSLADRLDRLVEADHVVTVGWGDAFCPSGKWLTQGQPPGPQDSKPKAAQLFARTHRLQGVMVRGPRSRAVVNNQCVPVGCEIDGFRLVSVSPGQALFEADGQQILLELRKPGEG